VKKYTSGQSTDVNVIGHMQVACWITKATDTHPEYVIHIAFSLQQWLGERPSILRCACCTLPTLYRL
jgi:hypothetical protein